MFLKISYPKSAEKPDPLLISVSHLKLSVDRFSMVESKSEILFFFSEELSPDSSILYTQIKIKIVNVYVFKVKIDIKP